MKKLIAVLSLALCILTSCYHEVFDQDYKQAQVEQEFQMSKLDCVNADLAQSTNYYGMGQPENTRTSGSWGLHNEYYLCIEDLGGAALDYNDIVIHGGFFIPATLIHRGGSYKIKITHANQVFETGTNEYSDVNIVLPFKNMHTPDSWHGAVFTVYTDKGTYTIPVTIKRASDQPAVIATTTEYKFHKDENSMTSAEFVNIPFYK